MISCDVKYHAAMGWHKFEIKPNIPSLTGVSELKTIFLRHWDIKGKYATKYMSCIHNDVSINMYV